MNNNHDLKDRIDEVLFKKLHHKYRNLKHSIEILIEQIKNAKVLLKFWKLPTAIAEYDYAFGHAHLHIRGYEKMVGSRDRAIKYLIEKLAKERIDENTTAAEKKEIYRDIYESYAVESVTNIYGEDGYYRIPTKYLTKSEQVERFEDDHEWQREAMCGCYETHWDEAVATIDNIQDLGFYSGVHGPEDHRLHPAYRHPLSGGVNE